MQLEWAVQQAPQQEQYWVSYIDALMLLGEYAQADSAIGLGEEFGLTAETAQMLRVELAPQLEAQPQASIKTKAHSDKPVATICTLIPAYKPNYIEQLLLSLATQTYPHFKVVISDDNPNDEVTALVQRLAQLDIYKNSIFPSCLVQKGRLCKYLSCGKKLCARGRVFPHPDG